MIQVTDFQKTGIGLSGFGITFIFLGILLFFDKGLLAIGNILFVVGLTFVIGLQRTFRFFFQLNKIRGTAAFFGGILVVLIGWPVVGMLIETYGFVALFRLFVYLLNWDWCWLADITIFMLQWLFPGSAQLYSATSGDWYSAQHAGDK